ncbi:MAG: sigma-54 dependent transcriptional regulator [Spirochaetaceae bacterium]|jgi:two-component system response regulator AtoC|nr:sigma-54 dependent transcriptional regulator [Spirochaetaceae bacterium]
MAVLIVDDEPNIRRSLKKYLSLEGIDAECAETGGDAVARLKKERFDAVLLDLKMPDMNGQAVLEWMGRAGVTAPVIMISAHGQIADAVNALKSGAKDYLVKPFDPADLLLKLRGVLEEKPACGDKPQSALVGATFLMRRLSEQIDKVAATDVTVLITGESGTGKEVAAREIHDRSRNREEPFTAVNIGGIHEGLMESELFGHEKGAFTGAVSRKAGLFELAGKGCLFLDEIGEMPPPLQVKLLRVLQERKIRPLGGTVDLPVRARIVSATNRDLEAMVREGRFREDLYYRINVFRITLPPLRERRDDIPVLADYLVRKLAGRVGRSAPVFTPEAAEKLRGYSYPGNIRELENTLERALIYSDGASIKPGDIDFHRLADERGPENSLESVEREAIRAALTRCQGNRTKAAAELGISRKTIQNKIKMYGLDSFLSP